MKVFEGEGEEVGVAIEMEDWKVYNDPLKFRRAFEREQIVAGVIPQPPTTLQYCFEHLLNLNEPARRRHPDPFSVRAGPGSLSPYR